MANDLIERLDAVATNLGELRHGPLCRLAAAALRERDERIATLTRTMAEMHERRLSTDRQLLRAEAEAAKLRKLAGAVCDFDWSDNDEDAVHTIANLCAALADRAAP